MTKFQPDDEVEVVRVLRYRGKYSWIKTTLDKGAVQLERPLVTDARRSYGIEELARSPIRYPK